MKGYKIVALIALFHFGSIGKIRASSEELLPPTPENRTITRHLERHLEGLSNRDFSTPCTTKDTETSGYTVMSGMIDRRYRWKNFYVFMDPSLNSNERRLINNAMYRLQRVIPCVKFGIYVANATPRGDYLHIIKGSGCWSWVGKRGGRQEISLGIGCWYIDTILHEMIHALGFHHEHARHDRDDHVTIHSKNIRPGTEHNFRKTDSRYFTSFGVPYNVESIMHYGSYYFSVGPWRPTITTKDGRTFRASRELQQTDIQKLERMYNCTAAGFSNSW